MQLRAIFGYSEMSKPNQRKERGQAWLRGEAGGEEAKNKALLITNCGRQVEGKGAPEKEPD